MADAGPAPQESPGFSWDAWLDGKLVLTQPTTGHRVGTDAVLLSAALALHSGRVVDVGAGIGAVGLTLAQRSPSVIVDLVETDAALAAIAADNAARNGLGERVRALPLDVLDARARRAAGLLDGSADVVLTNPPFFEPTAVRASPDAAKARAHILPKSTSEPALSAWLRASLAVLVPGGRFAMIHRPDATAAILAALAGRLGGVVLLPVYPREGAVCVRLMVSGVKGSRAPLRIAPGLVLHSKDGRLTPAADAIHRGKALLDWADARPGKIKKADRLGGDPPIR